MFDSIGLIADLIGIIGAVVATLAWLKSRQIDKMLANEKNRQNRKIKVILSVHGKGKYDLPSKIRRADLSRQEVLGRLGMIPTVNPKQRFSISYLNNPRFIDELNQLAEASSDGTLVIEVTPEELTQFDIKI